MGNLGAVLSQKLAGEKEPTISLHTAKSVPIEYVVDIARKNHYRVILATSPK